VHIKNLGVLLNVQKFSENTDVFTIGRLPSGHGSWQTEYKRYVTGFSTIETQYEAVFFNSDWQKAHKYNPDGNSVF